MRSWALSLVVVVAAAPATATAAEEEAAAAADAAQPALDPSVFDDALNDFHARDWVSAATGFWGYVRFGGPNAENREWAQFFLAESLRELGFWHAAVHYYATVAKTRSRPEILPQALGRLETISRERPVDEVLVLGDVIYDSEFGTLPQALADFVNYIQGLLDYRHDFVRWGEAHLGAIAQRSAYFLKARYIQAVHALKRGQDDKAVALLDGIIESKLEDTDTKNKAHLALARMLHDMGRYANAFAEYEQVVQIDLSFEQAQLLLEKAWTSYYMREPRRALGYLHALEAPSYRRYFQPDAYVLRALILKELCHYIPAKRALRGFRFRFGPSIDRLTRRDPLVNNRAVLDGATQEAAIGRRTELIKNLESERRLIDLYDSSWEDVELDKHLASLYDLALREQGRLWRLEFGERADGVARELLEVEEQVDLLDYEIGLDIFKRLKVEAARQTAEEVLVVPYDSANVYYEFDTEYWNDELHSYQVFVTNRCFEAEGAQ